MRRDPLGPSGTSKRFPIPCLTSPLRFSRDACYSAGRLDHHLGRFLTELRRECFILSSHLILSFPVKILKDPQSGKLGAPHNGPATTLEQAMLAAEDAGTAWVFGRYNMVGAAAGALGALAVTLPGIGRGGSASLDGWLFAVLVAVGAVGVLVALRLSPAAEAPLAGTSAPERPARARARLHESRAVVRRMAGLFAVDAAGGGLVTTGFLSYYFAGRYHVPVAALGWLFFAVSVVQAVSVAVAPLLARRFGLVATMVGTHLPSNVLLAAVAFAPTFTVAAALLLARTTLSQMDVPTRQALVMAAVTPQEQTPAAAVTNAARYTVRPLGPLLAGAVQQLALGAPLIIAGAVKAGYDVALWRWARRLPLTSTGSAGPPARRR